MKVLATAFLIALVAGTASGDQQTPTQQLHGALVSAKVMGSCAMLLQLVKFQESTQMRGGDEFLERFANMEYARLGVSADQYAQKCCRLGARV